MIRDKRYYQPSRGYDIKFTIAGKEMSDQLRNVRLVSSLTSPYQIIFLELAIDPADAILEKIYGQDHLKISIGLIGQDGNMIPVDPVEFNLLYLKGGFKMTPYTSQSQGSQNDRSPMIIPTVCRDPFKTMTSFVNGVYEAKTLREIIEDLTSQVGASLEMDSEEENKEKIDQVVIPPTTIFKVLKYLDSTFGIYSGISSFFCQFDNILYIKNLTKKMTKSQIITIDQLVLDQDNKKLIEKSTDGKNFYSYAPIKTSYSGNSKFALFSKNPIHIIKPKDSFFKLVDQDLEELAGTYGIIDKNKEILFDDIISERKTYYIDHTGFGESEVFAIAKFSKLLADLSTITIQLEKNLPILNLINVGEVVKFNTKTTEFIDLTGKYILKSSDLAFTTEKVGEWQTTAKVELIRTNKII